MVANGGADWKEGAIVMMDALGFKGIWKHHSRDAVIDRMHLIEESVRRILTIPSAAVARSLGFDPFMTFLSDTIVMAFCDPKRPKAAVALATAAAGYALHAAATDTANERSWSCPLAYRGAITFGRFYAEDRYVLGPAIDEAAEAMNVSEGAFVFLTTSARDHFRQYSPRPVATWWTVPLKSRGLNAPAASCETWVASPFAHDSGGPGEIWEIADLILRTFDRDVADPSVLLKRTNTEAFLRHAHAEHAAAMAAASGTID